MARHRQEKMSGVSSQQHFRTSTVATGARRCIALASFVAGLSWSAAAGAVVPDETGAAGTGAADTSAADTAPAHTDHAPAPAMAPYAAPPRQNYAALLGTAYVLTPFLALGVGGGLAEMEADDTVAVLGGISMFLLPAIVHMAHGNHPHGALSFLEVAGATGLGILVGGSVGYAIGYAGCSDHDSEECDFAGLPGLVAGAALGGLAGYTTYAIYDVASNASVPERARPASPEASLQLWMLPLSRPRSLASEASRSVDGVQLGATLRM
jgi:hypothetical protein